jgi:hypothetical protein
MATLPYKARDGEKKLPVGIEDYDLMKMAKKAIGVYAGLMRSRPGVAVALSGVVSISSSVEVWRTKASTWNKIPKITKRIPTNAPPGESKGEQKAEEKPADSFVSSTRKTAADMIWVLLSYSRISAFPDILAVELKAGRMPRLVAIHAEMKNLAVRWMTEKVDPKAVDELFDRAMLATVVVCGRGSEAARQNVERSLRYTPKDADIDIRPEDAVEEEKVELDGKARKRRDPWETLHADEQKAMEPTEDVLAWVQKRKFEIRAATALNEFIPYCASVFFEIMLQRRVMEDAITHGAVTSTNELPPLETTNLSGVVTRVAPSVLFAEARRLLVQWLIEQVEFDPTDDFITTWTNLCYRLKGSIGGHMRRMRGKIETANVFAPSETYLADRGPRAHGNISTRTNNASRVEIINDAKDYTRPALVITIFRDMLLNETGVDLFEYVCLADRTREQWDNIVHRTEIWNVPSRPVIVQLGSTWHIQCQGRFRYMTQSLDDVLLAWCYLILIEYNGTMEAGENLKNWCMLWFPAAKVGDADNHSESALARVNRLPALLAEDHEKERALAAALGSGWEL